ncbi:tetratricopeptide repeat protein [Actinocrispum wychmicini]|uniref:tetratricopeptide repeat protein n=1 Tax=Actinocrispum wychmicini TaxID=1213861 RepID=UPI0014051D27|nr:tetratricopeptide repeat protein [Actinocrispum wychmicini]
MAVALSLCVAPASASVGGDPTGNVIGTVTIPRDKQQLSVTIYDAVGRQPVRTLIEGMRKTNPDEAEVVQLRWDGTDDYWHTVAEGNYTWKALTSNVAAVEDDSIAQGSSPSSGKGVFSTGVGAVAADPAGNVYESSDWEEFHGELRKWTGDGKRVWGMARAGGDMAVAADNDFVYVAVDGDEVPLGDGNSDHFKCGQTMLMRYEVAKMEDAYSKVQDWTKWTGPGVDARGYILANASRPASVYGLAVDGEYLYSSEHNDGQVRKYKKDTGELVGSIPVAAPKGIAVDPATPGALWVATGGDVVKFDKDGNEVAKVTSLTNPYAVAVGGRHGELYVGDAGTGKVHRYKLTADGPAQDGEFFGAATPGPIADDRLRWPDQQYMAAAGCRNVKDLPFPNTPYQQGALASLAVLPNGDMVVADLMNSRVMTYNENGEVRKPLTRQAQFTPFPQVNLAMDPNIVASGAFDYTVVPVGPDAGRAWQPRANWRPNGPANVIDAGRTSQRRTLSNGRTYMYFFGTGSAPRKMEVSVYEYSETGHTMRLSTTVGQDVRLVGDQLIWRWFSGFDNKHVDGVITDDELTMTDSDGRGIPSLAPGAWVDADGSIWFTVLGGKTSDGKPLGPYTLKVPVTGFAGDDPKYDLPAAVGAGPTIAPDTGPEQFFPINTKIDETKDDRTKGDIYRTGWTKSGPQPNGTLFWMGGSTVERRDSPSGEPIRIVPRCGRAAADTGIPRLCAPENGGSGLSAVAPDGDYFYTATNAVGHAWITMYTTDGLVVATMAAAHYGTDDASGHQSFVDSADGLTAYTHPGDHQRYVLAEDSFLNRALRWHLDNMDSVHRLNGGCAKGFGWNAGGATISTGWGQCGYDQARALMAEAQRLWGQGARTEAVERALEAVAMGREIAQGDSSFQPTLAGWLTFVVSGYLGEIGRRDEAIALLDEGRGLYQALVHGDPANSQYRWGLVNAHMYLAQQFWAKGDHDQGTARALDAVTVLRQLAADDQSYAVSLGQYLVATANFLTQQGRVDEAIALGEEAVGVYQRLGQDPQHLHMKAWVLNQLATYYWAKGDHGQGIAKALDAIAVARQLPQANQTYAAALGQWLLWPTTGYLKDSGRRPDAIPLAREAVDIFTRLNEADSARYGPSLAAAKQILADLTAA